MVCSLRYHWIRLPCDISIYCGWSSAVNCSGILTDPKDVTIWWIVKCGWILELHCKWNTKSGNVYQLKKMQMGSQPSGCAWAAYHNCMECGYIISCTQLDYKRTLFDSNTWYLIGFIVIFLTSPFMWLCRGWNIQGLMTLTVLSLNDADKIIGLLSSSYVLIWITLVIQATGSKFPALETIIDSVKNASLFPSVSKKGILPIPDWPLS